MFIRVRVLLSLSVCLAAATCVTATLWAIMLVGSTPTKSNSVPSVVLASEIVPEVIEEVIAAFSLSELLEAMRANPPIAFEQYRKQLEHDPILYNDCHGVSHQLGHVAFETFGFSQAMSYQDAICGGGYIHGVVEARFGETNEAQLFETLNTVCELDDASCVHGVGHGLMLVTYLEVEKSLMYCDTFDAKVRHHCYDGVWMHLFDQEESGAAHAEATTIDAEHIAGFVARCAATGSAYKDSCYFYLPRIFAHDAERSFADSVVLCESVERIGRFACAAGAGHSSMKYHIAQPTETFELCETFADPTQTDACKDGASRYFLFATNPLSEGQAVEANLCLGLLKPSDQDICEQVRQRETM